MSALFFDLMVEEAVVFGIVHGKVDQMEAADGEAVSRGDKVFGLFQFVACRPVSSGVFDKAGIFEIEPPVGKAHVRCFI